MVHLDEENASSAAVGVCYGNGEPAATAQSSDTPISESKDATLNELFKPYLEDQHRQGRSGLTLAI
jgi:hypothetical protein